MLWFGGDCIGEIPGAGIQTVGVAGKYVPGSRSFRQALETDVKSVITSVIQHMCPWDGYLGCVS